MRIFSKNKIFILTILLVPLLYFINNTVKNEKIYFPIKEEDIEILGIKNANVKLDLKAKHVNLSSVLLNVVSMADVLEMELVHRFAYVKPGTLVLHA